MWGFTVGGDGTKEQHDKKLPQPHRGDGPPFLEELSVCERLSHELGFLELAPRVLFGGERAACKMAGPLKYTRKDLQKLTYHPVRPLDVISKEIGVACEDMAKLDANENLHPVPEEKMKAVTDALQSFSSGCSAQIYPDPTQTNLRKDIAALHGLTPEHVCAGSGSDDILDIVMRLVDVKNCIICPPTFGMYKFLGTITKIDMIEVSPASIFPPPRHSEASGTPESAPHLKPRPPVLPQPPLLIRHQSHSSNGGAHNLEYTTCQPRRHMHSLSRLNQYTRARRKSLAVCAARCFCTTAYPLFWLAPRIAQARRPNPLSSLSRTKCRWPARTISRWTSPRSWQRLRSTSASSSCCPHPTTQQAPSSPTTTLRSSARWHPRAVKSLNPAATFLNMEAYSF